MRLLLLLLALGCSSPLLSKSPPAKPSQVEKNPDILVFILDDVGPADLALAATPNIDALAASGLTFTRAYAAPTCAPGRMMLHTGHWWTTNTGPACSPPDAFTPGLGERFVSERLRAVGYTSAIFGKWHLGGSKILSWSWESAPKAQGWDYWICGSSANLNACGGSDYTDWQRVDGWASSMETAYQPDALRDAFVVEWPVGPTPKVVYVNLSLAHQPFHSPPGYSPLLPTVAKYNAMVEYADATIGAMLAVVDLQATTVI